MPYINVNISNRLSEREEVALKTKLGELIAIIPGKSEKSLMIGINAGYKIYFAGEQKDKVAYINISLYKEVEFEYKVELSKKIYEFFEEAFGITGDNLFITFSEYDSWGFKGTLNK